MKNQLISLLVISSVYFLIPTHAFAVITGVQLPSDKPITDGTRLPESVNQYQSIKYQYSLDSDQPIEKWVDSAKNAPKGGYQVLVSIAKNNSRIPKLKDSDGPNAGSDGDTNAAKTEKSNQYCWYPDELEDVVTYNSEGKEISRRKEYTPGNNGYQQFMLRMENVGKRIGNKVDAIEVWNEPNLKDEWNDQGLGEISPKNYAVFLECGIKGLRKSGYTKDVISAALAPLSAHYDDLKFFQEFTDADGLIGPRYKGVYAVSCVGWHGNVTKNIPPQSTDLEGIYRVTKAFENPVVKSKNLPICMTEFNWGRKQAGIDRQVQSLYIVQSFDLVPKLGNVKSMHIFAFGFFKDAQTFEEWDIEGTRIKKQCVPGEGKYVKNTDSQYITSKNLDQSDVHVDHLIKGLEPEEVSEAIKSVQDTVKESRIDVTKSFLDVIPGLLQLIEFVKCSIFSQNFCSPYLVLGQSQSNDPKIKSQETVDLHLKSRALANGFVSSDIEKIPEQIDCNFADLNSKNGVFGQQQVNGLSTDLGTTTGIYGKELPEKTQDFDDKVDTLAEQENLSIRNKLLPSDRRTPEIRLRCDQYIKANYPLELLESLGCSGQQQ